MVCVFVMSKSKGLFMLQRRFSSVSDASLLDQVMSILFHVSYEVQLVFRFQMTSLMSRWTYASSKL
jgi:hypothetical protein